MLMGKYAGYLYVNLTQDGVILEDGTSTEGTPPPWDWPVDKPVVCFIDWSLVYKGG